MYTKNDLVYSDARYYLKKGSTIALQMAQSEDIEEIKVTDSITDIGSLALLGDVIAVSKKETRKECVNSFMQKRYTLEDQVDILEKGNADDLKHLKEWKEWAEHVADLLMPTEPTLESAKEAKIKEIDAYDTSDNVNGFYVGGIKTWLSKNDRVGLMNSTNILIAQDYKNTDLWLNGNKFTIPCEALVQMLGALEVYALQCYSVTEAHKKAVNDAESIEELDAIDITADYPTMPNFEL